MADGPEFKEGSLARARRKRIDDAVAAAENGTEGAETNPNSQRNQDLKDAENASDPTPEDNDHIKVIDMGKKRRAARRVDTP